MRYLELSDHVAQNATGLVHRLGILDCGFCGVVNRLPVQAVEFRVRMAVAHGAPDQLEGFEVLGLLFWRQLGEERAAKNCDAQKNQDRPARGTRCYRHDSMANR